MTVEDVEHEFFATEMKFNTTGIPAIVEYMKNFQQVLLQFSVLFEIAPLNTIRYKSILK